MTLVKKTRYRSGQAGSKSLSTVYIVNETSQRPVVLIYGAADDLPLNVSRETLQQTRFLKQIKQIIVKRLVQLLTKLSEEDPEKFDKIQEVYGSVIKLGAVESSTNREKLAAIARFSTTQRNASSLDQVRQFGHSFPLQKVD